MTIQKQQGRTWTDESGLQIPAARLTPAEKLREAKAYQLARQAQALSNQLAAFKAEVENTCAGVVDAIRQENGIKPDSKGNITWYNFDRSIKVETTINEAIRFDEVLIDGARQKLMTLIDESISGDEFIKAIVADAFQTSAGKLDTRRVLGLKKHSSRIKNSAIQQRWAEAMELIDKSITRPGSKSYHRVWVRNPQGEYKNIDLNFSSINAQ